MKPRKREFKRDNKLKFAYIENHREFGSDFYGIVPEEEGGKWDLYLLFVEFLQKPVGKSSSLMEELEKRGYDTKTVYFEIEKKKENEK